MIQLILAAPASGSGKTMVTCALLRALQKRGFDPCAFKCGPDYIDPMFHRKILGVEGCNLDLFLSDPTAVRALYAGYCRRHDAAVCEGVMGYYDGLGGGTDRASTWDAADTLKLPVILVLRPRGAGLTLAALVQGLNRFRMPSHLTGILLNDCAPAQAESLAPVLERETGLPVLGCLPHLPQAVVASRHLGLYTADEITDMNRRLDVLAAALEEHADLPRLLELCDRPAPRLRGEFGNRSRSVQLESGGRLTPSAAGMRSRKSPGVRIAVARDEAFCFVYDETLRTLEAAGAELVPFSPVGDTALPQKIGGLYLPGGYPELYGEKLAENERMKRAVREAVRSGMPTVAECGGFLYLCQSLECETGTVRPMAGVLPGLGSRRDRLVRFGYAEMTAEEDSLLFRAGETVPVHEFHYWDCTENGTSFTMRKPVTGRTWREGFASPSLYAAFPHLYFAGHPELARRFVQAAREVRR